MHELLVFTSTSTVAVLGLGVLLGLKHATEADHLAAVTTMVSERRSLWSSALVGGLWGLGHTISLFVAGVFVLILDFQISEATERWLEFGVGVMLTILGLNVIRKLLGGGQFHFHAHEHGKDAHAHSHPHVHEHVDEHDNIAHPHMHADSVHTVTHKPSGTSPRALIIGMVHGLAGSAALMLLLIPTIESKAVGLLYIVIFGVGSVGGMMLMSFLVGLPFHFTASRFDRFNKLLQIGAGIVSVALGLWIIYEKGVTEGLFT